MKIIREQQSNNMTTQIKFLKMEFQLDCLSRTGLQRLVDYLNYKEATSNSKATQEQVDKLASDVKKGWWKKNNKHFIK